jgi:hypothetical protein
MLTGFPPWIGVVTGVATTGTTAGAFATRGPSRNTVAGMTRCWIAGTASGEGGAASRTVRARNQN